MVGVKEGHLDAVAWAKLDGGRSFKGERLLQTRRDASTKRTGREGHISAECQATHQNPGEVLVRLLAGFQDTSGVVDTTGIALQTEENLSRCRRAVDASSVSDSHTAARGGSAYKGERRLSSPARWSLWTWLRKHANSGDKSACLRKKSTGARSAVSESLQEARLTLDVWELGDEAIEGGHGRAVSLPLSALARQFLFDPRVRQTCRGLSHVGASSWPLREKHKSPGSVEKVRWVRAAPHCAKTRQTENRRRFRR